MKKLCVGIDVAKDKFDVMYTVDNEKFFGYNTLKNGQDGIKALITQLKKYKREYRTQAIHICMEATGIFLKLFSLKPVVHSGFALLLKNLR